MSKNNSNTLMIVGVAAAGYYLYNQAKKNEDNPTIPPDETEHQPTNLPQHKKIIAIKPVVVKPLTDNSKYYPIVYKKFNPDVKYIQALLGVKEDGIIGPGTLAVWKKYNPLVTERLKFTNVAALQAQITAIQLGKMFLPDEKLIAIKPVVVKPLTDNSKYYPIVYKKFNPDVKYIQALLGVKEDGIIGPGTLAVWKKYNPLVTERLRLTNVAALQAQITAIQLRKTFL